MLRVCAAVAIPAVVREIHQHLCALIRELAYLARKYGLVADKNSQPRASRVQRRARRARLKLAHFFSQPSGKRKQLRKRQVFSEGHQMYFVVTRSPISGRTHEG